MKFVKGLGFVLSKREYDNIIKDGDRYIIPKQKSKSLEDEHLLDVLRLLRNGVKKKSICEMYDVTFYGLNTLLLQNNIPVNKRDQTTEYLDKKIKELEKKDMRSTKEEN